MGVGTLCTHKRTERPFGVLLSIESDGEYFELYSQNAAHT